MGQPRGARTELAKLAAIYGEVQLATLAAEPPTGPGWSTELKADGHRIVALKADREVRLINRRTNDWTAEFRDIARAVAALKRRELVLDGEVCAVDEHGVPSFELLQNRGSRSSRLVYIVFDVLERDGEDLRPRPFEGRRTALAEVGANPRARDPVTSRRKARA
jgi:bifunctional non-homologous end joining protein LigD